MRIDWRMTKRIVLYVSTVHQRFAAWVDWLGVSQAAVGKMIGGTQGAVSHILNGRRNAGRLCFAIEDAMRQPHPVTGETYSKAPIDPREWRVAPKRSRATKAA